MAKSFPIRNPTALISMIGFGLLSIIAGLVYSDYTIFGFGITPTLMGFIIIIVAIIGYVEIGLKKFMPPKWSKLKALSTQQIVSLVITTLVLFTGISLMANFSLGFFGSFAGGTLIVQGFIILIEAIR